MTACRCVKHRCRRPAKRAIAHQDRAIQYTQVLVINTDVSVYWVTRFRG
jgi:hypothetical protein